MHPTLKLAAIGLVCAVPFGLAVRDEARRPEPAAAAVVDRALDEAPTAVEAEPELDDELDEPAAELDDRLPDLPPAALDELFGATAAAPGPLFDGIVLGASSQDFLSEAARRRIEDFRRRHQVAIDFDFDERELLGFRFTVPASIRDVLVARWGAPIADGPDDAFWLGADSRRVSLTVIADRADLIWSRYQTVAELIAPADRRHLGVEPVPVLGARLSQLTAALGPQLEASPYYDDQYRWRSPGLPTADTDTMATVVVERGVVEELVVTTTGRHGDQLRAALIAKYGPPADSEGTPWTVARWTGARTVEARIDDTEARIAVRR